MEFTCIKEPEEKKEINIYELTEQPNWMIVLKKLIERYPEIFNLQTTTLKN